jgi:hypothetical protein
MKTIIYVDAAIHEFLPPPILQKRLENLVFQPFSLNATFNLLLPQLIHEEWVPKSGFYPQKSEFLLPVVRRHVQVRVQKEPQNRP